MVALVLAALAALLLGGCDSGGHHRLLGSPTERTALSASELLSGCADPDPSCTPVAEQHLATQLNEREALQAPAATVGSRRPERKPLLCAATSRRGPPAGSGRELLHQVCVSRT